MEKPRLAASVILIVRQGSWAIISVLLLNFYAPSRHLDTVLALWTIAGLVSAAMGVWNLRKMNMGGWRNPVDWPWVKKGIAISSAFLLATLALRGLNTFDRYWLESLGSIDMVASYVLLLGIAGTVTAFLDAGVFAYG